MSLNQSKVKRLRSNKTNQNGVSQLQKVTSEVRLPLSDESDIYEFENHFSGSTKPSNIKIFF